MYVFNWHGNERTWRPLLTTIGAPDTLEGRDKVYAAIHRGPPGLPGAVNDRIYGETGVILYPTLTREGPLFHVPIHDSVGEEESRLESVELHLELEHFSPADRVAVELDGKPLGDPVVRHVTLEDPGDPADVDENAWLVWSLEPGQAEKGPHEVQVRLVERDARIRPPLVVQHVEMHINYRKG